MIYKTPKKVMNYINSATAGTEVKIEYHVWYDADGTHGCNCDKCKKECVKWKKDKREKTLKRHL